MRLLQSGTDTAVIALWLGHEQLATVQIYLNGSVALAVVGHVRRD